MKTYLTLFILITFSGQILAQKEIVKQFDASGISTLAISGNTMFKIDISTKKVKDINLGLQVEGENNEHVLLKTYSKRDTLFVQSVYQPLFVQPDDKLSAHKKISIELTIVVPEHLNITITSDIASVFAKGTYNNFIAELLNGHFTAIGFSGDLLVNTIHGNISVETQATQLKLQTKNGVIKQEDISAGENSMSLNSINGNISVTKTR